MFGFSLNSIRWPYREDKFFSAFSAAALIIPLAFSVFTNENFETIKFVIWLLLGGWALLVWSLQKSFFGLTWKGSILYKVFLFSLGVLGVLALASAVSAPDKLYSFFGFYYRFTNGFLFYALLVFTIAALSRILDRPKWLFLIKVLVFDALIIAIKAILESLSIGFYQGLDVAGFARSPGLLGNPNFTSMFLAIMLPFTLYLGFQANNLWKKIYYGVIAFSALFCLFILASRGALLALLIALIFSAVIFLIYKKSWQFFWRSLIAVTALLILGFIVVRVSRPDVARLEFSDVNIDYRLQVWGQSWQAMRGNPWLGVGLGNFAIFHERQERPPQIGVFDDAHNLFLHIGATGGFPLVLAFLALIFTAAIAGLCNLYRRKDVLSGVAVVSLVVFLVGASFTPVPIPAFLVLSIIVAALMQGERFEAEITEPRKAAKVLAGLGGAVFIIVALCLGIGETALATGYRNFLEKDYDRAAKWFRFSKAVNPTNQLAYSFAIQSELRQGQEPEVLRRSIQSLGKLHPQQAGNYVLTGNLYYSLFLSAKQEQDLEQAISSLQTALKLDPFYPERYAELGFYYYQKKDINNALRNLDYSLELNSKQVLPWILKAKIYQQQNDRTAMTEAIERAYLINSQSSQLRLLWYVAKQEPDLNKVPLNILFGEK